MSRRAESHRSTTGTIAPDWHVRQKFRRIWLPQSIFERRRAIRPGQAVEDVLIKRRREAGYFSLVPAGAAPYSA